MAITFNDLAKKVGIGPALLQSLEDTGVAPAMLKSGVKFIKDGEGLGNVPIAPSLMAQLEADTALSSLSKQSLHDALTMVANAVIGKVTASSSPLHGVIDKTGSPAKPGLTTPNPAPTPTFGDFGICTASEIEAMGKVQLSKATKLYQPVNGSDSTSRYFAVALCQHLKMGARWKSSKLSIRFEGDVPQFESELSAAGVTCHGNYASIHVGVGTITQARKAIGALMMAVNAPWGTPLPDLAKIQNKGN